jgi:hypothetical protein
MNGLQNRLSDRQKDISQAKVAIHRVCDAMSAVGTRFDSAFHATWIMRFDFIAEIWLSIELYIECRLYHSQARIQEFSRAQNPRRTDFGDVVGDPLDSPLVIL